MKQKTISVVKSKLLEKNFNISNFSTAYKVCYFSDLWNEVFLKSVRALQLNLDPIDKLGIQINTQSSASPILPLSPETKEV